MNFKKLALAAAIASVPAVGFSVETLEDTDLGGVTGQDGIQVEIDIGTAGIKSDIYLHDTDGLDAGVGYSGYSFDGAILIRDLAIAVGSGVGNDVVIEIDAGASATSGGAPVLNVNVDLPNALTIATGYIQVANSQIDDGARGYESPSATIFNNMTIVLGSSALNIQLGNEQQTGSIAGSDMIVISASITNGITLSNFRLSDATGGGDGGIGMTSMSIDDAGAGTSLTVAADINVTDAGLEIGIGQLGSATGMSLEIVDQYLGSTSAGIIGDLSIVGLNLNGTKVTISGK